MGQSGNRILSSHITKEFNIRAKTSVKCKICVELNNKRVIALLSVNSSFVEISKEAPHLLFVQIFQLIEDIQIFGMNMPFISSSEAKNVYFMSDEATNFLFIIHSFKPGQIFCTK